MNYLGIEKEFVTFIQFPTADRSIVTSTSAKLFAQHIARIEKERADRLQAELDELKERIGGLKEWAADPLPERKRSELRGFGVTITGGGARSWYVGIDGVRRWTDCGKPCGNE